MALTSTPFLISRDRPLIPLPRGLVERFPGPEHARWGLGTSPNVSIPTDSLRRIGYPAIGTPATLTHPLYDLNERDWFKWRLTYEGGERFVQEFTQRFSRRESPSDFIKRKLVTPIPAFAKAAINEIKNAIFQRAADTARQGGPASYQNAILGEKGGVDLRGATMNWFMGHYVIPELLPMKKVGVYVDNLPAARTLADQQGKHPYFYIFRSEDIRSWAYTPNTEGGTSEFSAILLREYRYLYTDGLPQGEVAVFRKVWIAEDNYVHVQFYDAGGIPEGDEQVLTIRKIPFVVFEISDSLLKDVANSQIALLNLESSDINYALKSNFPFYTEQFDPKNMGPLVRAAQAQYQELVLDGELQRPATRIDEHGEETAVGSNEGRRYPKGVDRPEFIAPPTAPLTVSMAKQEALKSDIRQLVHLAVSSLQPKTASAESKAFDQQGLESGLSYIGLELERGERLLAAYWSMYENTNDVATIHYPKHWSLKSLDEVQKEVKQLQELRDDIPSQTYKKEINKKIALVTVGISASSSILDKINLELDASKGASSNPKIIVQDVEAGILGLETAVELRGYPKDEPARAANDHTERLTRIAESQSSGRALSHVALTEAEKNLGSNPAARGLPDLSGQPAQDAAVEKVGKPGRGSVE